MFRQNGKSAELIKMFGQRLPQRQHAADGSVADKSVFVSAGQRVAQQSGPDIIRKGIAGNAAGGKAKGNRLRNRLVLLLLLLIRRLTRSFNSGKILRL